MIAPLKESTLDDREAAHWAGARRAVAALLLGSATYASKPTAPVGRRTTWLFVAWAIAIAALYLTRGVWWIDSAP
jgi:hypothetical protein